MNQHKNRVFGGRIIEFENKTRVRFNDKNDTRGSIYQADKMRYETYDSSFLLMVNHTYLWLTRPVKITFVDDDI